MHPCIHACMHACMHTHRQTGRQAATISLSMSAHVWKQLGGNPLHWTSQISLWLQGFDPKPYRSIGRSIQVEFASTSLSIGRGKQWWCIFGILIYASAACIEDRSINERQVGQAAWKILERHVLVVQSAPWSWSWCDGDMSTSTLQLWKQRLILKS